jgi:hypothetical protein
MAISSALGSSALLPAGLGFRNKIINGDMRINQRAATITGSASQQLVTDRWSVYNNAGTVTFQQSTIAPPGYTHSLLATVTATGSYSTSDYTMVTQFIEGFNTADLAWGTASAKPVVVSFWVRSSVVGTYTVALQNNAQSRSYISTYTINSANTWEQKIIYIPGETTGSWSTDNSTGVRIWFGIGLGTSWDTTAGVWQPTNSYSVSGSVDFSANAGATFAITGVQLEANTQPTPFEQRPIGVELELCQRYYIQNNELFVASCTTTFNNSYSQTITYPTKMRAAPTLTVFPTANLTGTANEVAWFNSTGGAGTSATNFGDVTPSGFSIFKASVPSYTLVVLCYRASIEL